MVRRFLLSLIFIPLSLYGKECLDCHNKPEVIKVKTSIHAGIKCEKCHPEAKKPEHARIEEIRVDCGKCHIESAKSYFNSIHGRAMREGIPDVPSCKRCHGGHDILKVENSASRVSRENVIKLCTSCHMDKKVEEKHHLPGVEFIKAYTKSIHSRRRNGKVIAVCVDCHGVHSILPPDDPSSLIYKKNIPNNCGKCHQKELSEYKEGIHFIVLLKGVMEAPVCTDCHGEHTITSVKDPNSPVYPAKIPGTCAQCHEEKRLTEKYSLVTQRLTTYFNTFHGIAIKFGDTRVANCASCHGAHKILPKTDPRSSINPANLKDTCGRCHPGATENFAKGKVHVDVSPEGAKGVYAVRVFYTIFISILAIGFVVHIFFDLASKRRGFRK